MDISNPPDTAFQFQGCEPSKEPSRIFTDNKNPFVDLHLDFPVRFGEYVMGHTPYLMAVKDLEGSSDSPQEAVFKLRLHSERLSQLNYFHSLADEIKVIINLYLGKNKQLFKRRVASFLKKDLGPSLKPQDVNAALYQFLTFIFLPFVNFNEVKYVVEGFTGVLYNLEGQPLDDFIRHISSAEYLSVLQKDCLKLYPEIYKAELALRPALYLDLIDGYEKAKVAARISTKDFQSYKDIYKDIAEVFSRQLVLVAGINNIIHRGDFNCFAPIGGKSLSSLNSFSEKNLSDRFKYLDDCWYILDSSIIDASVRNSIAHFNVDYDDVSQVISYYPKGGKIETTPVEEMYFIDFMRMILVLFREVNNLHHLIKCLFYYQYFIIDGDYD